MEIERFANQQKFFGAETSVDISMVNWREMCGKDFFGWLALRSLICMTIRFRTTKVAPKMIPTISAPRLAKGKLGSSLYENSDTSKVPR